MNKNENRSRKQNTIRFWLVLAAAALAGGIIGFLSNWFGKSVYEVLMAVREWSVAYSVYILIVINVIIFSTAFFYFFRSKKLIGEWNQEDEEVFDKIDKTQGMALAITTVGCILNMVIYGFILTDISQKNANHNLDLIGTIIFLAAIIALSFVQRLVVDETKKLRPEKQGDALAINFQKTWVESCDEQERQSIYKASYKAFSTGNVMYPILLVVLMLGQLFFNLGITPMLVLGVIWGVQTVTYQIEALKK